MAKAFDGAPKKRTPWRLEGRQGWSVIDAPSTRLSLVGLRPRTPDHSALGCCAGVRWEFGPSASFPVMIIHGDKDNIISGISLAKVASTSGKGAT
jgi:hypothetical protein